MVIIYLVALQGYSVDGRNCVAFPCRVQKVHGTDGWWDPVILDE